MTLFNDCAAQTALIDQAHAELTDLMKANPIETVSALLSAELASKNTEAPTTHRMVHLAVLVGINAVMESTVNNAIDSVREDAKRDDAVGEKAKAVLRGEIADFQNYLSAKRDAGEELDHH